MDRPSVPTPSTTDGSLLRRLADGQLPAADALYQRYAERIRSLARARLPAHVIARADPDDVVQSVFRAFFESARRGLYQVPDGQTLWHLLVVVTVNKVRSLHAHHSAARRDARLTIAWEASEADRAAPEGDLMELAVRDALERLPAAERVAVELRLEGYEIAEIAGRTGRSKRSVERSLQKARAHLNKLMDASPA